MWQNPAAITALPGGKGEVSMQPPPPSQAPPITAKHCQAVRGGLCGLIGPAGEQAEREQVDGRCQPRLPAAAVEGSQRDGRCDVQRWDRVEDEPELLVRQACAPSTRALFKPFCGARLSSKRSRVCLGLGERGRRLWLQGGIGGGGPE